MPAHRTLLRAALCALLVSLAGLAPATTVVRQTLESLTDQSDVVVRGLVERIELRVPAGAPPFRLIFVRVTEDATGHAPARIPVRLPGGVTADGLECAVAGTPSLGVGDDVVLFLSRVPESATSRPTTAPPSRGRGPGTPAGGAQPREQWQPVALALGTWRVGDDVAAPDAAARGLHQVGEDGGAPLKRTPVAELLAAVRARKAAR